MESIYTFSPHIKIEYKVYLDTFHMKKVLCADMDLFVII